jgi:hypothetical protein
LGAPPFLYCGFWISDCGFSAAVIDAMAGKLSPQFSIQEAPNVSTEASTSRFGRFPRDVRFGLG